MGFRKRILQYSKAIRLLLIFVSVFSPLGALRQPAFAAYSAIFIEVGSTPGTATVKIDGNAIGELHGGAGYGTETPADEEGCFVVSESDLKGSKTGVHKLTLEKAGYQTIGKDVDLSKVQFTENWRASEGDTSIPWACTSNGSTIRLGMVSLSASVPSTPAGNVTQTGSYTVPVQADPNNKTIKNLKADVKKFENGAARVTLSWDAYGTGTTYRVYRGEVSGNDQTGTQNEKQISTTTSTSYTNDIAGAGMYTYRVDDNNDARSGILRVNFTDPTKIQFSNVPYNQNLVTLPKEEVCGKIRGGFIQKIFTQILCSLVVALNDFAYGLMSYAENILLDVTSSDKNTQVKINNFDEVYSGSKK